MWETIIKIVCWKIPDRCLRMPLLEAAKSKSDDNVKPGQVILKFELWKLVQAILILYKEHDYFINSIECDYVTKIKIDQIPKYYVSRLGTKNPRDKTQQTLFFI